jgi:glycosyl hydrolase family 31
VIELPNTPEEIVAMPLRDLALAVLARLARATLVNRRSFIAGVYATMPPRPGHPVGLYGRSMNREPEAAYALAEAWSWLEGHGLVGCDPIQERNFYFVTPDDPAVWDFPHQYMFGDDMLVSPVLARGIPRRVFTSRRATGWTPGAASGSWAPPGFPDRPRLKKSPFTFVIHLS